MVKMSILIEHKRMATSMKYSSIRKGLEHLYYSMLFASDKYRADPRTWTQWLSMGFGVSVREQPRAASPRDKLVFDTASMGPKTEITVTEGNQNTLAQLHLLLDDLEGVRKTTADEGARWEACMSLPSVENSLLTPMTDSMNSVGLRPDEVTAFLDKASETITVLTEDNIETLTSSLAPDEASMERITAIVSTPRSVTLNRSQRWA